ncbi:uncharacterized protein LOC106153750 isoform X1 [Lingula anatina]|uniref:Elongation factor Tu n=1 Tax=Lingula anatina TaxID=7574 RepID=A0A1S3HCP2_LINAN|nr:uncharacterized protein LOC106153750 isoform X1 [Lingula anatina]|eukprot:XP_013383296.1 uncharacterized protein LOC106153750 isoform X1 [Lingula anatina]
MCKMATMITLRHCKKLVSKHFTTQRFTECLLLNQRCLSLSANRYAAPVGQKKAFVRDKPHMNIGTIGHVDHGKTTLTAAITRVLASKNKTEYKKYDDIDNAPEEKTRGITINAACIEYSTDNRHYGHVDCPGHKDYIKNMITGSAQMEAAILVIAATDGVMPQTKEHLILAKQIGISNVVVFVNKADAADAEMLELVDMEMKELLDEYGFDSSKTPIIVGSALNALEGSNPELGEKKILELLDAIDSHIPTPVRDLDKPFYLPVEYTYQIEGRGTVVTGKLERGKVKKGEECELLGHDKQTKTFIAGIEMFRQTLDQGQAGDQMGILLRGMKRGDVRRGMVVAKPKSMSIHNHAEASIYLMSKEEGGRPKPLLTGIGMHLYSKTWDCPGQINMVGKDMMMPGEDGPVQVILRKKMVLEQGQRFTIRDGTFTVGYGVFGKPLAHVDIEKLDEERKKIRKQKEKEALERGY